MQKKKNFEFKPVLLCLKIDLVLHPARSGGEVGGGGQVNKYMHRP